MDSIEGHTPTPWHTRRSVERHEGEFDHAIIAAGRMIAETYGSFMDEPNGTQLAEANAALIVRAVNSHKALVEALAKDVERFVRIRAKLLSWNDMSGTQRAYFANWVWHAENETRDALRLAGEDQS